MVTVDGRLVHVDFGYALGKEPLDSMLIHLAVQGGPKRLYSIVINHYIAYYYKL